MTFKTNKKNAFLPFSTSFVCILSIKFTFIIITSDFCLIKNELY